MLADLSDAEPEAAAIRKSGGSAAFEICDVADAAAIQHLIESTVERFGGIDILVNNAGIPFRASLTETSEADWDRVMAVNLKGVFLCCRAAIPFLAGREGAAIVNVASELGLVGQAESAAYCASKGGVIQLTRSIAIDHARDGIRANCVCPGPVDTPLLAAFVDAERDRGAAWTATEASALLGRVGRSEEIAAAIAFLASDDASYMTGAVMVVDGGVTVR